MPHRLLCKRSVCMKRRITEYMRLDCFPDATTTTSFEAAIAVRHSHLVVKPGSLADSVCRKSRFAFKSYQVDLASDVALDPSRPAAIARDLRQSEEDRLPVP